MLESTIDKTLAPPIVTAEQMKAAEAAANAEGHSYDTMMELAGRAVAEAIETEFGAMGNQITILIGPGNNGGDGLVAARYLSDMGATLQLYIWQRANLEQDLNWQRLADYALPVSHFADDIEQQQLTNLINQSAIVVDALLGTGVSRPIEGDLAQLLTAARAALENRRGLALPTIIDPLDPPEMPTTGPAIVAVDLPSGLYADNGQVDLLTLPADMTITFAAPKRGHIALPGAVFVGQLLIADIDIDVAHFPATLPCLATPTFVASLLPERPISGHKGTFGKALVVAGCQNYTGAPALSATAAYRVGAGLVSVAIPASIQPIVAANLTEATYIPLADVGGDISPTAAESLHGVGLTYSAILVGPGLGQAPPTQDFLTKWFTHLIALSEDSPLLVFDADAINYLAKQPGWWAFIPHGSILTPHPGEMSRLTNMSITEIEANRFEIVAEMAHKWGQIILFKGAFTVIASPTGDVVVMPFANPALSTAGSGDVLAGCITGLLAQGVAPFEAAVVGAYLHGLAGEMARERIWEAGVMAGDLLPLLPLAMRELAAG